jgi:hypothetical protein|tara:strand:+ start:1574 stop:2002 length:429 start_codon:yes stop_codon:yes gene_type:complete
MGLLSDIIDGAQDLGDKVVNIDNRLADLVRAKRRGVPKEDIKSEVDETTKEIAPIAKAVKKINNIISKIKKAIKLAKKVIKVQKLLALIGPGAATGAALMLREIAQNKLNKVKEVPKRAGGDLKAIGKRLKSIEKSLKELAK